MPSNHTYTMSELEIGDRVKVIDQDITGEIVSINHAYASILDDDRHEWMDSEEDNGTLEFRVSEISLIRTEAN